MDKKLSVVLATHNEEANLAECLESVRHIASEIIIVDGQSTDRTVEIANSFGAKVISLPNQEMFHINKQKALDEAVYPWILQLDADERVSVDLAKEIVQMLGMSQEELEKHEAELPHLRLFKRHQDLLSKRDGVIGREDNEYAGFFIPRLNYFLGRYLKYGGVYPDGVIRLLKKGKAHFPCKDVHEQIVIDGKVGWLQHPLYHIDSPTFQRYIQRNNRYTDALSREYEKEKLPKTFGTMIEYCIFKPIGWFLLTFFRHKGFLDGWQGFVFSFFSSRRFAIAYMKYTAL